MTSNFIYLYIHFLHFHYSFYQQPDGTKQYDAIHYKWLQDGNMISSATEISMTRKVAETKNLLVSCEVGNKVNSETSDSLTHTCIGKNITASRRCYIYEKLVTCYFEVN